MAFCENCGKEIADGEQCTCTVTEAGTPAKGKSKKVLVIAVAAVVVIILIAALAGGSKGYMSPVEDFLTQINKKNTETVELYAALMPDFGATKYEKLHKQFLASEEYEEYYEDYCLDYMEDYYDECDDEFSKWKYSFEVKKAEKLDEDDLEDIQDWLDDYFDDYLEDNVEDLEDVLDDDDDLEDAADELDISESKLKSILKSYISYMEKYEDLEVTAGYDVKGKFIVKAGKDEYSTKTVEFRVVKINGDWTYWGLTDGSIDFGDDEEACFDFIYRFLGSKKLYVDVF